jgi:hypothetical protein
MVERVVPAVAAARVVTAKRVALAALARLAYEQ